MPTQYLEALAGLNLPTSEQGGGIATGISEDPNKEYVPKKLIPITEVKQ